MRVIGTREPRRFQRVRLFRLIVRLNDHAQSQMLTCRHRLGRERTATDSRGQDLECAGPVVDEEHLSPPALHPGLGEVRGKVTDLANRPLDLHLAKMIRTRVFENRLDNRSSSLTPSQVKHAKAPAIIAGRMALILALPANRLAVADLGEVASTSCMAVH